MKNPKDDAEMIWIPPGDFLMGDNDLTEPDEGRMATNAPRHTITLKGYWIYKTPVTRAQYRKFCSETVHSMPYQSWLWREEEDQPVGEVTWDDAMAYCGWAGVRLPVI